MNEKEIHPNFLETPQQDIKEILSHENLGDEELQYALDRSCTPHCVEAIAELEGLHLPSLDRIDEYVSFLRSHGAHPDTGTNNTEIYGVDDGWYNVAIADLLRINGYQVVSQQLQYGTETANAQLARKAGRVRTEDEMTKLDDLTAHGGETNINWLKALSDTVAKGGYVIASIKIPSSKVEGMWGRHSIVVTGMNDQAVFYFDPDKLVFDRYKNSADNQRIVRQDESKLIYAQQAAAFLDRLTGEVMHIFPPTKA